MDEDLKKKAAEALKASADVAKKLGGIACDLGKRSFAAAGEKARELAERAKEAKRKAKEEEETRCRMEEEEARLRMEEARAREAECRAERPIIEEEHLIMRNVVARRVDDVQGDPEDKCFLMSYGCLYFIWWLFNIVDTILFLLWFSAAANGYQSSNTAWIPIVVWLIALLFNRLAYEGSIAFFEMVRHLRQIRDELRRHNMREDKREYEAREKLQRCEIPEGKDGEGCQTGM